jgi:hypothetical protein
MQAVRLKSKVCFLILISFSFNLAPHAPRDVERGSPDGGEYDG